MSISVLIRDESPGRTHTETRVDLPSERMKVRDLIQARVYREVDAFNSNQHDVYRGLVQPDQTEVTLNGFKMQKKRRIDPEKQYLIALDAFVKNGYFIIVNDAQAESLDQEVVLNENSVVAFVRLVPLVGG
jgi:hypothetical protein